MVYYPVKDYSLPDIDVLSLIFDSPLAWLTEDQVAHAEAAQPENYVTKAQFRTVVKRLSHVFRNQFGIGANGAGKDVVVCMSSGQILLPAIFYAVIGAGGVYSAASSAFTPGELARQIKQGPGNLLVVSEDCVEVAKKAASECGIAPERLLVLQSVGHKRSLVDVSGRGKNYLAGKLEMDWERITDPETLATNAICLLYSSGTTGPPKGVHVSHRNMVSEALIPHLMSQEYFEQQKARDSNWKFEHRTLAHLPAAHVAGCQGYFVNPIVAGGPVYWMPKFDFAKFLEYNKEFSITSLFTVPPICLLIVKSPLVTDQFAAMKHVVVGAAPISADLKSMTEKKLGCIIGQTWGLSETTGCSTYMPWGEQEDTGSVSPLMPNCRLRIVDEEEKDVVEGQEGEMLMKGPIVTIGYWKNESVTKESFTRDGEGWFKTGDVGVCKDGKFYIVDRKKEMIKYKGLQVAPAELEGLLLSHELIQDAAVIGIPDPSGSGNELPRAYIVADQAQISEQQIKDFVKKNLATHKQLRGGVIFMDVIPKSPSGKILRRILRDSAKAERDNAGKAKL